MKDLRAMNEIQLMLTPLKVKCEQRYGREDRAAELMTQLRELTPQTREWIRAQLEAGVDC